MAVTVTDDRVIRDEADGTTGWVAAGGTTSITLFTADPAPVESTGCIGTTASNATTFCWHAGAAVDLSAGRLVYVWVLSTGVLDTRANGGLMLLLGDGTNRIAWHLGGSDIAPFRHDEGPVGWMCMVLDTANLPTFGHTVQAGTLASLNFAAITDIGAGFKTLAKAVGGAVNCWVDIIRHGAAAGSGLIVRGGTSGDPGKLSEVAALDRSTANQRAHGVIRELGAGLYGCQGPLRFGGAGVSWFEDKNVALAFESRGLGTSRYELRIEDDGVDTSTFRLGTKIGTGSDALGSDGVQITFPVGVGGLFDAATDADVTDVFIYGSSLSGATNGVKLRTGHEFIGCSVVGSGTIEAGGATMVNTAVVNSTGTRALLWDVALDTLGRLDGMRYISAGTGHGIELGPNTPTTIDLKDISFSGYASSDGSTGNEALYNNSGKTITVNIVGGTTPSVRNGAGSSTTLVANPVTLTVTVKDVQTGSAIENARVLVAAAAGGPFPYQDTVSITRSGTTATVTHTGHGMATNQKVMIKGVDQIEYRGVHTITVVDTNTYTYEVSGSPVSPATGTIVATAVMISGLTDVNGQISDTRTYASDQPIEGRARKSTTSPLYKTGEITGTVSSTSGLPVTVQMIPDE